jgi:hypothetical protein
MLFNYTSPAAIKLFSILPKLDDELANIYLLLAYAKGKDTTLEDVHNAWTLWEITYRNPEHPSAIPFKELSFEVQELDRKYMEAIHAVAEEIANGS